MRRATPLTAAGLLGLALLAPTSAVSAAAETCRGEAATVVGTTPTVTGTEGRDVIVTGRATQVLALGGDDLVCVVPDGTNYNVLSVDAGAGNDVVDTTGSSSTYYIDTDLGAGADVLEGGAASDAVIAGDPYFSAADVDTVRTGSGNDAVTTAGESDVVDLGPGTDRLTLLGGRTAPDGLLAGGDGEDTLKTTVRAGYGDTFDLAAGVYRHDGGATTAHFSSFEGLELDSYSADIGFHGTEGADRLTVSVLGVGPTTLAAFMLGGHDDVVLSEALLGGGSRIDAGAGEDRLVGARSSGSLALDLKQQQLRVNDVPFPASGVENAFLMAPDVLMAGDAQDNTLIALACTTTITGGHGDDELIWDPDYYFEAYSFSCTKSAEMRGGPGNDSFYGSPGNDRLHGDGDRDTIRGGAGNDRIHGGRGADRLLGEGGRDTADGNAGRDRCVAERERRCER
ncbi:calcium-binding protein [Nocardioides zhouii]|uniref:Calcium-binding protein n=1 Tax=Nocardioides zhouii TaxID=1168729 RepID=A0A4Q2SWR1_9ACTN|nr:calcium-binding protein [Nocardioides zhouii]RYC10586.1 calcium-binding protein [Nocardioides zhouii]